LRLGRQGKAENIVNGGGALVHFVRRRRDDRFSTPQYSRNGRTSQTERLNTVGHIARKRRQLSIAAAPYLTMLTTDAAVAPRMAVSAALRVLRTACAYR
jgi:hypothetical protein